MLTVFLVQHERRIPVPTSIKLIGVYTSRDAAEAAMGRLRVQPGFRDLPDGFSITEVEVDRDHWQEGFGVPHPPEEGEPYSLRVVCAYCNTPIAPDGDDPVELFVRTAQDAGEQGLYAHATCLRRSIHPNVPLLAGLAEQ